MASDTPFGYEPIGAFAYWDRSQEPPYDESQPNDRPYIHRDAARAWQAFRDFLNGSVEQWQRQVGMAFERGVEFSLSSYRPKRKPHYEAKPYTGDSDD